MTTLKKASIEELEKELESRKNYILNKETFDNRYEELKQNSLGHCIIYWEGVGGGSSKALLGNYQCGDRWFVCANWVDAYNEMKVYPLREFVMSIKKIEMI